MALIPVIAVKTFCATCVTTAVIIISFGGRTTCVAHSLPYSGAICTVLCGRGAGRCSKSSVLRGLAGSPRKPPLHCPLTGAE
ncbi:hypothetical protein FJT64_001539 [Amphibalanus amphitrite]|uniref:Uncharacterized protein n=1 Tax=Amphibalanus amphitrite TaxID=1232801 RepID=A0A6A4X9S9_AMPAM|nr:hypothetical protein FJT64_001539 [Amphibalanus amphitrite]